MSAPPHEDCPYPPPAPAPRAQHPAATATKRLELEFEKSYFPLLLYSKKRYVGLMWTSVDKYDYVDYKGVQPVRRDTPQLLKQLIEQSMRHVCIDRRPADARAVITGAFDRICAGDYTVDVCVAAGQGDGRLG